MRSIFLILILSFFFGNFTHNFALAHSGGLNSNGCHAGSQPYHCHRSQAPRPTSNSVGQGDCLPNYVGICITRGSDVDCAGGSGNGPRYARGPFRVVGSDPYGLDRDGDGIGCE